MTWVKCHLVSGFSSISNNAGPCQVFFSFFPQLLSFFFAHFTIHSCEWSCSLPLTRCIDDHGSLVI